MSDNQVDTQSLRKRLQAQLNEIQEQLRAIDIVERLSRQGNGAAQAGEPSEDPGEEGGKSMSVAALDALTDDWQSADVLVEKVRAQFPGKERQPIMTAYRRWEERGKAEIKGSRTDGFRIRRKKEKEAERATP